MAPTSITSAPPKKLFYTFSESVWMHFNASDKIGPRLCCSICRLSAAPIAEGKLPRGISRVLRLQSDMVILDHLVLLPKLLKNTCCYIPRLFAIQDARQGLLHQRAQNSQHFTGRKRMCRFKNRCHCPVPLLHTRRSSRKIAAHLRPFGDETIGNKIFG